MAVIMDITKYIDERTPQPDRPHFTRERQPAGPVRSRQIYINHQNEWMLRALAKAQSFQSKDAAAEAIILGYFQHNHPGLVALYRERTALDDKAAETIQTAAEKK